MTTKNSLWFCARLAALIGTASLAENVFSSEPPPPNIVHILATDPCGAEAGSETATFTVVRTGSTNAPLTLYYRLAGAAENGADYHTLSGAVTIPAGARTADIVVTPIDDSLVEGTETIFVELVQPLVWPPPYIVCWPSFAFGHIEDNDFPPTNHPPSVALVSPPDGSVFMGPVDITLFARASDSDGRVHHVEFFAGTTSLGSVTNQPRPLPHPFPVFAIDDDPSLDIAPDEFPDFDLIPVPIGPIPIRPGLFRLVWEDAPPGHYVLTAVATDDDGAQTRSAPVEITVTEPPPQPVVNVVAVDPVAAEGPWPTDPMDVLNTATFAVRRSGNTDIPITVFYRLSGTASNGVDYQTLPHSVTIPVGARGARVVVAPIDDNLVEGTETVVLTIVPPVCIAIFPPPPDCYLVGRHHTARAIIRDNDTQPNRPPVVEIVRPLDGSVFLAPADVAIVAQARDSDGTVVAVEFFEGTNSLGVVSNNVAALNASRPPFFLVWSNAPAGHYVLHAEATDNGGAISRSVPVEIKVVQRSVPPTVNIVATDADASETGGLASNNSATGAVNTAMFNVSRTGPTTRPLLVRYSLSGTASNGLDYRRLTGEVTIPVGAASANIVVHPIDDRAIEGTESVIAAVDPSPCLATSLAAVPDCYLVGANSRALAYIRDNDTNVVNQPPKVAIVRPEDGDAFIAPADITLVAEARDGDGLVRSVEFFANGSSLGIVSNRNTVIVDPNGLSIADTLFKLGWSNVLAGEYALTAKATDNRGAMGTSDVVRIKVVFPEPPVVSITATDPYAAEGGIIRIDGHGVAIDGEFNALQHIAPITPDPIPTPIPINNTATFTVRRSGGTNHSLVVYYSLSGAAAHGADYRTLSGHVTIPRGSWTADIVVDPIDDALVEGTETVIATLDPIACPRVIPPPPECYVVGEPGRALAYIHDNDVNQSPKVEIVHPSDDAVFPVSSDIEIDVLARDPDGYVTKVEFFAGTNLIGVDERIFIVAPPPGQVQRFSIIWSNVPPGEYKLSAKATDSSGAMTRSDSIGIKVLERTRIPVVTIETTDKIATEQSPLILPPPDAAAFRVSRTGETNRPLVVFYDIGGTAQNGLDYRRLSGQVTIPAGSASAPIIVEALDDSFVEDTETVILKLQAPDCLAVDPPSPGCYLVGHPGRAEAYIRDNDPPPNRPPVVALISPPDGSVFVAPTDIRLVARASDPDGYVVTVEFFEGTNSLGIVTNHPRVIDPIRLPLEPVVVAAGGGVTPAPGPVDVADELIPIPLNLFRLLWEDAPPGHYTLTAVATDNRGARAKSDPVEIKVTERPEQPVVTIVARDPKAFEGCPDANADCLDTATFVVKRSGPTNAALRVYYRIGGTASNGVDYRELANGVEIPAGSRTANIVVEPIDDNLVEGTETVVLALALSPACLLDIFPPSPDCYHIGRAHTARAAIYDNDTPPNRPPEATMVEPEDGDVFSAPADIKLTAKAGDYDGQVVLVEFFEGTNKVGQATGPSEDGYYRARWIQVPAGHYVLTAVATDNRGATGDSEPVEIKVVDRHEPPVVNIVAIDAEARELSPLLALPPDPATFRVTRTGSTNRLLVIYLSIGGTATDGVDYAYLRAHVTIPAGASSADLVVDPIDDLLCEGDESVVIGILPSVCVAEFPPPVDCYVVGPNSRARAVIHDDDVCPTNVPPKVALVRPENDDVFTAPADIRVCAEAKDADGRVVKVEFFEGTNSIGGVRPGLTSDEELFCIAWTGVRPGAYVLTAVATDNKGASTKSDPVRIKVIEEPTRPVVYIRAVDPVAAEGGATGTFAVSRSCCTNAPLLVFYGLSGTASNGVDYRTLSNHVTIPAGSFAARVVVDPIDDNRVEGTETVVATLRPSPCAVIFSPIPSCYTVGHYYRDTVYIRDNDSEPNLPPHVAILIPDEGASFAAPADIEILAVALDPDGWVTQIQFFEGTNQIGGLAILVSDPPPNGELQTFRFNWNGVPAGAYTLTAKVTDNRGAMTVSGPIHIRVHDSCRIPVVTITATDAVATEPNPGLAMPEDIALFTVRRTCGLERPLLVRYSVGGTAANGVDYFRLSGEVVFNAGESSARILVNPMDDNLLEGTETVVIELQPPVCIAIDPPPPDCYLVGRPNRAVAYIRDNDTHPPFIRITSPYNGQRFTAPGNIPVMARGVDPDGWIPHVDFYANGKLIGSQDIAFFVEPDPGQWQEFVLRWTGVDAGHYVLTAKATDNLGAMSVSDPVEIDVVAPPARPEVTIVATDPIAREGDPANTAAFRVRRNCCTNEGLTVWFTIGGTASNGVDYIEIRHYIHINPGARSARVTITPMDDRRPESVETVVLRLIEPPTANPLPLPYTIGRPAAAAAFILDNDHPLPHSMRLADGLIHVRLDGPPGNCFRVEASSDLRTWEPLCTTSSLEDALHFVDPESDEHPHRFYRIVEDVCDDDD